MIYRKWSLLTGPAVVVGGIIGTIVVANLVIDNPFLKGEKRNPDVQHATK